MPRYYWYYPVLASLSQCYPKLKGRLPTCYAPVRHSTRFPKETFSFDLHVLSTPPAFILSQDQTLQLNYFLTQVLLKEISDLFISMLWSRTFSHLLPSFQRPNSPNLPIKRTRVIYMFSPALSIKKFFLFSRCSLSRIKFYSLAERLEGFTLHTLLCQLKCFSFF